MTSTPITTHVQDALARMLEQYKKSPRLRGMVAANAAQTQSLEDAFNQIKATRSIDDAVGVHLDRIGAILGVPRPGQVVDYVYRVILKGQAAARISKGRHEDIIRTYKALTSANTCQLENVYPAKIKVYSDGSVDSATLPYVALYLQKSLPIGVGIFEFGLFGGGDDPGFGFFENPNALGFGDLDDPDAGGGLGELLG